MGYIKVFLSIVVACLSFTVSGQNTIDNENKKGNDRAKVETVKGQTVLVLKAGRNTTIDLKVEANTWCLLDSIVTGPWGSAIKLQNFDGHWVDVAKASINSSVGLLFTSGSKCVALKKDELDTLKK